MELECGRKWWFSTCKNFAFGHYFFRLNVYCKIPIWVYHHDIPYRNLKKGDKEVSMKIKMREDMSCTGKALGILILCLMAREILRKRNKIMCSGVPKN